MGSFVYAGSAKWVAASIPDHKFGLFRLDTDVDQWERLSDGLPDDVEIRHMSFSDAAPGTLYVGTQCGPYRSEDAGESWTALALPSETAVVWSLLLHPKDPKILYAGTEAQGVFRTENGGNNWSQLPVPTPEGYCDIGFPSRTVRMALDPANPDEIYAGIEVGGLLRSLDAGETWTDSGQDFFRLAAEENPEMEGGKGNVVGMMDTHSVSCSAAVPGTVFFANRLGIYRSDDKGDSWRNIDVGRFSDLTYSRDIQVSRHDPNVLFAAFSIASVSDAGSLYRSTNLGESWSRFDHGVSVNSTMMHIGQSAETPDRVYFGARRGQVFGTEDGGKSWREVSLPEGVEGLYAVAAA